MINHCINLGVYQSRIEEIFNAKGEYILLKDPDDIFLNQNLFKEILTYYLDNNINIIVFSV